MDADEYDRDSTFGGDRASLASSSTSLRSEVTRYEFEHGRRYHGYQAGKYYFPNDEKELNRIDIEHHNQRLQMNGALHLCPLEDPMEIIDIGTGSGVWCIEMAEAYPGAQVLGIDLSPVQPSWVPPNCHFEVDDFELDWTYGDDRFDMINHRFLIGSISNHSHFYKQAFNALKPGGWIELVEMEALLYCDDDTVPVGSALREWGELIHEVFGKMGRPFLPVEKYKEHLEDAGFENVTFKIVKRPTCDWPKDRRIKEIGRFCALNLLEGLEGFTMAPFTRVLHWRPEEVTVFLAKVRKDILRRRIHGYMKSCVCYGQKPLHPQQQPSHH
ncbi:hypothetical protein LTS16_023665 [Friedmanniomyces endolithicus]|nr:hypothetical protein LTR94_005316 [Friedmanniomyces endolithicus]KAK0768923.1 hypothetical protein LTR59_017342 [Friedmanniomyces endolithicus]KAK0770760.1 hypothetical protein LTR38_017474 [Friedmanniomyces endolithicus]KAK0815574.1 hypothetical protein LTR75_003862 [Friedmanniomyces endolithicus]KAK0891253.1 hypothetical protein LTR57_024851 [Friedmanniomyces endolithicus]